MARWHRFVVPAAFLCFALSAGQGCADVSGTQEVSCSPGGGGAFEAQLRKAEAFQTVTELNAKAMNALDMVMATTPGSPEWSKHIQFVESLQPSSGVYNLQIDRFPRITDQAVFEQVWTTLAAVFKYRKRHITNYFITQYADHACLRTIRVHGVGTSFGILEEGVPLQGHPGAPAGQFHISRVFVDFDRFEITWAEESPGDFRVQHMSQITEATFPLPEGASVVSSPVPASWDSLGHPSWNNPPAHTQPQGIWPPGAYPSNAKR
jgi:hypothetical protein